MLTGQIRDKTEARRLRYTSACLVYPCFFTYFLLCQGILYLLNISHVASI